MEEEHSVPVRPGHDTRTGMAIAHCSMASGRYSVIIAFGHCLSANYVYGSVIIVRCDMPTSVIDGE